MRSLWLFIVLAAAVLLVALVVFFVPVVRNGWSRLSPSGRVRSTPTPVQPPSPLVRGFGYLYVTPRFTPHRHRIEDRLARAFRRIDAVDPDAAPRRIGLAMLQAGLVDPPSRNTPDTSWSAPWGDTAPHDEPGETR